MPEGGSLLDLGCATGSLTRAIADRFEEITVVDASDSYLRQASERLGGAARARPQVLAAVAGRLRVHGRQVGSRRPAGALCRLSALGQ